MQTNKLAKIVATGIVATMLPWASLAQYGTSSKSTPAPAKPPAAKTMLKKAPKKAPAKKMPKPAAKPAAKPSTKPATK